MLRTETARREYRRASRRDASDLSDAEWASDRTVHAGAEQRGTTAHDGSAGGVQRDPVSGDDAGCQWVQLPRTSRPIRRSSAISTTGGGRRLVSVPSLLRLLQPEHI